MEMKVFSHSHRRTRQEGLIPMKSPKTIARHPFVLILSLLVAMFVSEPVVLAQRNPSWISTGNLNIPRSGHTATLLANGKVLVVGGWNDNRLNSAELYDPASGTWSVTGSLNIARDSHTATLLPNGKVLVAGGLFHDPTSTSYTTSAELYDPATASWTFTGSLHTERAIHTATRLQNGKILVVGEQTSTRFHCSARRDQQRGVVRLGDGDMERYRQSQCSAEFPYGHTATQRKCPGRGRLAD
jgi:N-acetylneuraminic acid mutarotase